MEIPRERENHCCLKFLFEENKCTSKRSFENKGDKNDVKE
jgi:hypothetical protein